MEIHQKRGIWFVTAPGREKRIFDTEAAAIAYTKGFVENEPDDEDDDEYYDE